MCNSLVFFKKIGDTLVPYFYHLSIPSPRKSERHGDFSEFTNSLDLIALTPCPSQPFGGKVATMLFHAQFIGITAARGEVNDLISVVVAG